MTPQSSAAQCDRVARELERLGFRDDPFDPAPLLRSFEGGYVRFHNTKARRLLRAREDFPAIDAMLDADASDRDVRNALSDRVHGLGMKEASHFLRNIGRTHVTIIDRHILRNLVRLGVIDHAAHPASKRQYLEIEALFDEVARDMNIPVDAFDLLLWRRETGFILR